MKNNTVKNNEGYHPANIPLADYNQKKDTPPEERVISKTKIILYDANENPLVRRIGF